MMSENNHEITKITDMNFPPFAGHLSSLGHLMLSGYIILPKSSILRAERSSCEKTVRSTEERSKSAGTWLRDLLLATWRV